MKKSASTLWRQLNADLGLQANLTHGRIALSPADKALLRTTFSQMESNSYARTSIFVWLFRDYPHYQQLWPQFRLEKSSPLARRDVLEKHAVVFTKGLRTIMNTLDDERQLAEYLDALAISHAARGVGAFHIEQLLPTVLAALQLCCGRLNTETMQSWAKLFKYCANMLNKQGAPSPT